MYESTANSEKKSAHASGRRQKRKGARGTCLQREIRQQQAEDICACASIAVPFCDNGIHKRRQRCSDNVWVTGAPSALNDNYNAVCQCIDNGSVLDASKVLVKILAQRPENCIQYKKEQFMQKINDIQQFIKEIQKLNEKSSKERKFKIRIQADVPGYL